MKTEPHEKVLSCWDIEHNIISYENSWSLCCADLTLNSFPVARFPKDASPQEKVQAFVKLREDTKAALAAGRPCACTGCKNLAVFSGSMKQESAAELLVFQHTSLCNLKCFYCIGVNKEAPFNVPSRMEVIAELEREGLINPEKTKIDLSSGEISIHSKRQEILTGLRKYRLCILSNCVVYDESIAEAKIFEGGYIDCSVDAGTKETYAKIKGVDCFDKVCANLRKYAEKGSILLKYIFLPGINDNDPDFDGFVRLAVEIKPMRVRLSRDMKCFTQFDDAAIEKLAKLYDLLEYHDLNPEYFYVAFSKNELSRLKKAGFSLKRGRCKNLRILEEKSFLHQDPHAPVYDIKSIEFVDSVGIVLHCGRIDPQIYLSLSNPLERPSGISAFCEITYTNSIEGDLKLYWDYGEGLSEENSTHCFIEASAETASTYLRVRNWKSSAKLTAYRVDPPNGTQFVLKGIKILEDRL